MDLLEKLLAQIDAISGAWVPFLLTVAIVALAIWRIMEWHYRGTLEGFEQRLKLRDDAFEYRERERRVELPTPPSDRAAVSAPVEVGLGAANKVALAAKAEGRIYVPKEVDPAFLRSLYHQNTTIQAEKLVAAYIGKWIQVESTVLNVIRMGEKVAVSTRDPDVDSMSTESLSTTWFSLRENFEQAEMLRAGDRIKGEGRIASVDGFTVDLDPAELS